MKGWLFEKINKIDKHLAGVTKRSIMIQINKIGDEWGNTPEYTSEIQKNCKEYTLKIYISVSCKTF